MSRSGGRDDVEVVEQPLGGGRRRLAAPGILGQRGVDLAKHARVLVEPLQVRAAAAARPPDRVRRAASRRACSSSGSIPSSSTPRDACGRVPAMSVTRDSACCRRSYIAIAADGLASVRDTAQLGATRTPTPELRHRLRRNPTPKLQLEQIAPPVQQIVLPQTSCRFARRRERPHHHQLRRRLLADDGHLRRQKASREPAVDGPDVLPRDRARSAPAESRRRARRTDRDRRPSPASTRGPVRRSRRRPRRTRLPPR